MEKLIVSNFLNLKDIELDLNKFNIIIGPQAQGKSVLAKLVFFFKDFWQDYRSSILEQKNKTDFDNDIRPLAKKRKVS
jgi:AAA15 family ATPase/GTPase